MSLEDDIARIAALRGRKPDDYAPAKPRIHESALHMLVQMSGNVKGDQAAFDDLPAASRAFISEWPRPINSQAWRSLLFTHDEQFLIRTFQAYYADVTGTQGQPVLRRPRKRRFS